MIMRKKVRLVKSIQPERYSLILKTDLNSCGFEGDETIALKISKPTKQIILHAKDLKIEKAQWKQDDTLVALEFSLNDQDETLTLNSNHEIRGRGDLQLKFSGVLNDQMCGLYRSTYEHAGKKCIMATTQFEATDARRAFPCFDEPAMKAIFDVTLIVPEKCTAISNTLPEIVKEHSAGWKSIQFAPTPKMSTYLLAFIVGDLEWIEGKTKEGVLVRVFTTPGKKSKGKFALDAACKMISFYNDFFGIPYPLPVLDLIAVPDFSSGAMENWGAVTFRESMLLVGDDSSLGTKQGVAIVVAHELAHQWFGNLVTMEWWTHLWLNEGFATYLEYLATDHCFPEWKIWDQFSVDTHASALELDGLRNTHAIEIPVHHPHEISEIFDSVSYAKGSTVIRMLADYIGEEAFKSGLSKYLKTHAYGNAATEDLWRAFAEASGKPVEEMMSSWTKQPGYPLVSARREGERLILRQERFIAGGKRSAKELLQRWKIPVRSASMPATMMLSSEEESFVAPLANSKLNAGEIGLYRVRYEAAMFSSICEDLASGKFDLADQVGLIRDSFALAQAGFVSVVEPLTLMTMLSKEPKYELWSAIIPQFYDLSMFYKGTSVGRKLDAFLLAELRPVFDQLGFEKASNETHNRILLRGLVIWILGLLGDKEILAEVAKRFDEHVAGKMIDADIQSAIFSLSAHKHGYKSQPWLIDQYQKTDSHEIRNRLGRGLGFVEEPELIKKALDFALSPAVRSQDAVAMIARTFQTNNGPMIAWEFVQAHWSELVKRYEGMKSLARVVQCLESFDSMPMARSVKKFLKAHPTPGAERTTKQVLETIEMRARFKRRAKKELSDWFKAGKS